MYPDSIKAGSALDTLFIKFYLEDGDADLGNDQSTTNYDIFLKDSRYDTGYGGYFFPYIDPAAENSTMGLKGTCTFKQLAAFIVPRNDTVHMKYGDTVQYELYIKDRAGHASNHITTPQLYIKP